MAEERESGGHLKQILAGVVVALLVGGSAPWWWTEIFGNGSDNGPNGGTSSHCDDPAVSLSRGAGPSGTEVVVRGSGYPADEAVEVRFHTEALPPARTSTDGTFEVDIVVPGTFDPFAPKQFEIRATTTPTVCFDSAPFELTR